MNRTLQLRSRFLQFLIYYICSLASVAILFSMTGCGDDCTCRCQPPDCECPPQTPETPTDGSNDQPVTPPSGETQVTIDFDNIPAGTSIMGLGAVNSHLNIQAIAGDARVVREGVSTWNAYGAPNNFSLMANGCIGSPGNLIPVMNRGSGFSDMKKLHHYVFTFNQNESVKDFSITMLDFGDWCHVSH